MKRLDIFALFTSLVLVSCGGGAGGSPDTATPRPTEIFVAGSPGSMGIFDPAPMSDGGSTLWMSHSAVRPSPNNAVAFQVRTRIAASSDGGSTWTDAGVDPNNIANADLQVPYNGGATWATWRFEVSRLLYDPYDSTTGKPWKMLWHRVLAADFGGNPTPIVENSWIGLATATTPNGTWTTERKLFAGSGYNATAMNAFLGAPEFPLAVNYAAPAAMGNCYAFTEPGLLARNEGIYVSMQCLSMTAANGKIVLLRCDHTFASCNYLGDLLTNTAAAQFANGQTVDGFAASELVDVGSSIYLIVTSYETRSGAYHGCLVFQVSDLARATVLRNGGNPVLVKRVAGTVGSFNGACGYHAAATGSGIIYSEIPSPLSFHLYASHVTLP